MYEAVFEVDHHHPQQEFSETECVALLTEVVGSSLIHHLFSCLKKSERVVVGRGGGAGEGVVLPTRTACSPLHSRTCF